MRKMLVLALLCAATAPAAAANIHGWSAGSPSQEWCLHPRINPGRPYEDFNTLLPCWTLR